MNHTPQRASDYTSFSAYAAASTFARYLDTNYSAALPYADSHFTYVNMKAINRADSGSRWAQRQALSVQFGYEVKQTMNIKTVSMSVWTPAKGWYGLEYPFIKDDAGRSASKRPKQDDDCTVRALAKAVSMDYDTAYDLLKGAGRKSHRGFDFKKWAKSATVNGRGFVWTPLQAVKGHPRMTIAEFAQGHKTGVYILRVSKHVLTMIDGVVYDTFESRPDKCVYGYWQQL